MIYIYLIQARYSCYISFGNQRRASIIYYMNILQTMTYMGVRKGLYWGFQIEHRNKKNLKNTITLYTLISPPPERNDQPVIDLCTIDRQPFVSESSSHPDNCLLKPCYRFHRPLYFCNFCQECSTHMSRSSQSQIHEDDIIGLRVFNYNNY